MSRPRAPRKGESDLSYALAMLNFHRFSDRIYGGGRKSRYQTDAEKRVLDLGGKIPPPKKSRPRRSFKDTLFEAQRNAAKKPPPGPRKGPVQRMPQRPSTLGKLFKDASTKPKGGFLKALGDSPMTKKSPRGLSITKSPKKNPEQHSRRGPFGMPSLTKRPSPTSQYRGGSGKKKYNQASYFAGLGVNPNTKQNQGIYKPYANGGGVRKPKYKE